VFTRAQTDVLEEGKGVGSLLIDEATLSDAASALGVSKEEAKANASGMVELRTPERLRLVVAPPESGEGEPRLYAVSVGLWEPFYRGRTGKGIAFLDTVEKMREVYGEPEAVAAGTSDQVHYYPALGLLVTTTHLGDMPRPMYAKARSELGKEPDAKTGGVVTGIMVVRPFQITEPPKQVMAGQQVISLAPKTTILPGTY
jgi:hypothetical protein